MMNALFDIPTEVREDTLVIKLPSPLTRLPREKPVRVSLYMWNLLLMHIMYKRLVSISV